MALASTLTILRQQLAALERPSLQEESRRIPLGVAAIDELLRGGLAQGTLHEMLAADAGDAAAMTGFSVATAARIAQGSGVLWVRQEFVNQEAGGLYAPGVAEFGLDPATLILVRARDATDVLQAAGDALHCAALAVVLIETWGRPAVLDLTATRRLAFAAEKSGVTALLLRRGAEAEPSAAETRWAIGAASSHALEANAPGFPVFNLTLLRHRAGISGQKWKVEWDRGRGCFREWSPLSRAVVSLPGNRQAAQEQDFQAIRRAG